MRMRESSPAWSRSRVSILGDCGGTRSEACAPRACLAAGPRVDGRARTPARGPRVHPPPPRRACATPTALHPAGPANGSATPASPEPWDHPGPARPAAGCWRGGLPSSGEESCRITTPHPSVLAARLLPGVQLGAWPARGPGAAVDVYSSSTPCPDPRSFWKDPWRRGPTTLMGEG